VSVHVVHVENSFTFYADFPAADNDNRSWIAATSYWPYFQRLNAEGGKIQKRSSFHPILVLTPAALISKFDLRTGKQQCQQVVPFLVQNEKESVLNFTSSTARRRVLR